MVGRLVGVAALSRLRCSVCGDGKGKRETVFAFTARAPLSRVHGYQDGGFCAACIISRLIGGSRCQGGAPLAHMIFPQGPLLVSGLAGGSQAYSFGFLLPPTT